MMNIGRWSAIVAVFVSSCFLSTLAFGQDKSDKNSVHEASQRYQRGTELVKEENYRAALVEFRRSYELTKEYRVLYNIGQVCSFLQDYVCALTSFETYLNKGGTQISDDRKAEVEAQVTKLKPRIGFLDVQTSVFGADVSVDDIPRGKTPLEKPIPLSAGQHKLTVVKEGKVPVTRTFEVAGGDNMPMKVDLMDSAGQQVIVRETGPREPPSKFTALSWIGIGTAGAMAVGAGITGVIALNASNDLKKTQYTGDPSPDATSLQSRVKTMRTISDVLTGAAIVTLGVTLYLTLTRNVEAPPRATASPAPPKPVSFDVQVGLGNASLIGTF